MFPAKLRALFYMGLFLSLSASCERNSPSSKSIDAIARLKAKNNSKVHGSVEFSQARDQVVVDLDIKGLGPTKKVAVHIHEGDNCEGASAKGAGSHFNPLGYEHGSLKEKTTHAGDLGNVESDENGNIKTTIRTDKISLVPKSRLFIVKRTFVVHNKADDLITQPSGGAGDRIGCGVIEPDDSI